MHFLCAISYALSVLARALKPPPQLGYIVTHIETGQRIYDRWL